MSCCGKNRRASSTPIRTMSHGGGPSPGGLRVRPLQYVGSSTLTALGPSTGRVYRFTAPGARLTVDPRDWSAMARLPALRPG